MSDKQVTQMLEQLKDALAEFEKETNNLSAITTLEQLPPVAKANARLQQLLGEAKQYFTEVRASIPHEAGIPPAKELAQLVIGGATEAYRATRETEGYLQQLQTRFASKVRFLKGSDDLRLLDLSTKEALRGTHYIIKRMTDFLEKPSKHK
jgi:ABC-type transporter Mla subunit MlaD